MSLLQSRIFYYRLAQITPIAVFILMIMGSYVKAIHAGLACPDWPLCYGQIYPGNVDFSKISYTNNVRVYS